jgi:porin
MVIRSKHHALSMVVVFFLSTGAHAQEDTNFGQLEAAASASIGGPGSAQSQLEADRLRRLQDSRWPGLDAALNPTEAARERLRKRTGLNLSFDYQALYQHATNSLTGQGDAALGQARILGDWALFGRSGPNPGSLVFILENRHLLHTDIAPSALAGEIGYSGVTGLTFSDTGSTLSVAYWAQTVLPGRGGFVAGRIDPGDYTDVLGYVNPRTTFSNFAVLLNPVLPIPDPGFGVAGGTFVTDQVYVLAVVSDANGSLTDVDWFPGGSEFYTYAELGWTPAPDQRYLTNFHIGAFHIDARTDTGAPETSGAVLSGNVTFRKDLMVFGRLGWSEGAASLARQAASGGLIWRPGTYDDLFGIGITLADPSDPNLGRQTTAEAFYRIDVSDNLALTADVQYLNNPGFNDDDPILFGLRLRFNL